MPQVIKNASSQSMREASSVVALKLLRELLDFDQRLRKLTKLGQNETEKANSNSYLVTAYRKELRQRKNLLVTLPPAPEYPQNPWTH